MTSFNGNILRVAGSLFGELTGHRWIPIAKTGDAELWCFLWSVPWMIGRVNNREAGELIRHRTHYDVIVMNNTVHAGLPYLGSTPPAGTVMTQFASKIHDGLLYAPKQ